MTLKFYIFDYETPLILTFKFLRKKLKSFFQYLQFSILGLKTNFIDITDY